MSPYGVIKLFPLVVDSFDDGGVFAGVELVGAAQQVNHLPVCTPLNRVPQEGRQVGVLVVSPHPLISICNALDNP